MKKLSTFFTNPFLQLQVVRASRENKEQHSAKVLAVFTQHPPAGAQFPPLIEAYRLAYEHFSEQKQETRSGMQKAATKRLERVRASFILTARQLSNKVRVEYESTPSEYTIFFPRGLYKATRTKRGDIEGVIGQWLSYVQERQAVLGAAMVTRLTELKAAWDTAANAQAGTMSRAQMARNKVTPAWEAVAWAGYDLARALLEANPRKPGLLDAYFDMKMFTLAKNKDADGKADIRGTVATLAGLPVARAMVTFTQVGGGKVYQVRSNTRGMFRKKRMLPALYDFTVKSPGLAVHQGRVQLLDSANPDMEVVLRPTAP